MPNEKNENDEFLRTSEFRSFVNNDHVHLRGDVKHLQGKVNYLRGQMHIMLPLVIAILGLLSYLVYELR